MKILLFDNYDSFTYNLVHLVEQFDDVEVEVFRNDEISLEEVARFDKIILSPGPGLPDSAGILKPLIKKYSPSKSILGVCLGHQAIGEVFGAKLFNLEKVRHGMASVMTVVDSSEILFKNIPVNFKGGHYHSWMVSKENLPDCFQVTCEDSEGFIMGMRHKTLDVRGVQFHPESILTEYGKELMENWIETKSV